MEFKVTRVGSDGEGIAYHNNKPVYIYYAYKNEVVEADLFTNVRGAQEAKLTKVIKPSKHRIEVNWPYYMKSGSVNLMHINYHEQLKYKRDVVNFLVATTIKNETKNTKIGLTIPSDKTINYRNKSDIPLIKVGKTTKMANFFRGSNLVFPINELITEEKAIENITKVIINLMDKYKISPYDAKNKRGHIASITTRVNQKGQVQVTFVARNKSNIMPLVNELMKTHKNVVGVYENYIENFRTVSDIYNGDLRLLKGEEYLEMGINKFKFHLTPHSFFQLNTNQAEKLYQMLTLIGDFNKDDIVLDAYSGVGTIATHVSPLVKKVVAIESIKAAVQDMDYSLKVNNITNVKTITGDFVKLATYIKDKFTKMIFNPPRTGLGPVVCKYILKIAPKNVIYVSCNPKTMVTDLKLLSKKYNIESITPFDIFPQTSQIENIVLLTLKTGL